MIRKYFLSLLPEYANNALGPVMQRIISWWLITDPAAQAELQSIQHLREAVHTQSMSVPSVDAFRRIQAVVHISPKSNSLSGFWKAWAGGMGLILLSFIILWNVLPPGIVLQWSAQGGQPETFRVYRAETTPGTRNFELVHEIAAAPEAQVYIFRDFLLVPGKEYVYRVEVIDQNGLASNSHTIMSNAMEALPGQLALFVSLIITGYGVGLALQKPKLLPLQLV